MHLSILSDSPGRLPAWRAVPEASAQEHGLTTVEVRHKFTASFPGLNRYTYLITSYACLAPTLDLGCVSAVAKLTVTTSEELVIVSELYARRTHLRA